LWKGSKVLEGSNTLARSAIQWMALALISFLCLKLKLLVDLPEDTQCQYTSPFSFFQTGQGDEETCKIPQGS